MAQVFLENQIESCDLLKMDIEGYEYKIFELMDVKTLCLIKRITMECHFPANLDESKLKALINRLRSHGFIIEIKKILSNNTVVFLYGENQQRNWNISRKSNTVVSKSLITNNLFNSRK